MATDKKQDYVAYDLFDPFVYIKNRYAIVTEWNSHPLKLLHNIFQSYGSTPAGLKVLEFGCGPVPTYQCSAPLHASEIVFAEYAERNRNTLQMWLDNDPNAPDFTALFKYVVQDLEGKGDDEVQKRQDDLRRLVKGVIPCDILCDPPLLVPGYEGPYDIIFSSLCLTTACTTREEYSQAIGRVTKYLKPGGKLILQGVRTSGDADYYYYSVGSEQFYALSVTPEFRSFALSENGYKDISFTIQPREGTSGADIALSSSAVDATVFTVATKK